MGSSRDGLSTRVELKASSVFSRLHRNRSGGE